MTRSTSDSNKKGPLSRRPRRPDFLGQWAGYHHAKNHATRPSPTPTSASSCGRSKPKKNTRSRKSLKFCAGRTGAPKGARPCLIVSKSSTQPRKPKPKRANTDWSLRAIAYLEAALRFSPKKSSLFQPQTGRIPHPDVVLRENNSILAVRENRRIKAKKSLSPILCMHRFSINVFRVDAPRPDEGRGGKLLKRGKPMMPQNETICQAPSCRLSFSRPFPRRVCNA